MSIIENRNAFRPETGEAPFELDEVFFSRTDARGVISAGNSVFNRVANYTRTEMLGAPHKLIRHPDMPKGVFWLLWDTIKRGETVGAYVKNRAKDGLHYWVFATVIPCGDGYLSARFKPISPLREIIEQEYADLKRREEADGLSPEKSAQALLQRLGELGFEDYHRFATHALSQEMIARDKALEVPPSVGLERFRRMHTAAEELKTETEMLMNDFAMTDIIPHNMRVIASRLEPSGGPLSTLSTNYGSMAREMSDWFEVNVFGPESNFAAIEGSVVESTFIEGMSRLLTECSDQLESERGKLGDDIVAEERKHLLGLVRDYSGESEKCLAQVNLEAKRIVKARQIMDRFVMGLNTTESMCRIEGARLSQGRASLDDVIAELSGFQNRVRANLKRIEERANTILHLSA